MSLLQADQSILVHRPIDCPKRFYQLHSTATTYVCSMSISPRTQLAVQPCCHAASITVAHVFISPGMFARKKKKNKKKKRRRRKMMMMIIMMTMTTTSV